ncbi:MAG: two-component system, OmpR family, response regulator CpxR [Thermoanaerobaculia bacterium]|jgi:DNA-binding response OmpR family regulator|nr:two-component system, OmpR family, response regulator CpxR [Thermoanaerobaculia bacterium]
MAPIPQILVVEDDSAIRALLVAALRREPFHVHAAVNGADALTMTRATDYAVILLDLMMPTLNGIEFLEAFHEAAPASRTVIFVMTAGDDTAIRRLPANLVHGFVRKPFDVPQLVSMVREVALTRQSNGPETTPPSDHTETGDEMQADQPN